MELKVLLKNVYKKLELQYPKFFKMDLLCQLAFISNELLLKGKRFLEKYDKDKIAIVLSNSSSSLDTDINYHDTIKEINNYFPSPSMFVYTLPSIMSGEIAIRTGITGENNFFISKLFNPEHIVSYLNSLFNTDSADACLSGWVELDENKYDVFMFTVEPIKKENLKKGSLILNRETLDYLYK